MFPIKYLENNLVLNQDGECMAYYELIPYNYSFLSPQEKMQMHDEFRQLVAQQRDGRIHALQVATESGIRQTQENSKRHVRGKLKALAEKMIDLQTERLVEQIGDNQIDYRFFIGFQADGRGRRMEHSEHKRQDMHDGKGFFRIGKPQSDGGFRDGQRRGDAPFLEAGKTPGIQDNKAFRVPAP